MHRLIRRSIRFTMPCARGRAHALRIGASDNRSRAHSVAMFQRSLQNVGYDFHVAMSVGRETVAWLNEIFVDYSKRAKENVLRVVIFTEGECVIGVEPTKIKMAALLSFTNRDHKSLSS